MAERFKQLVSERMQRMRRVVIPQRPHRCPALSTGAGVLECGMGYREIMTINPDQRGGKPCIRGLRITVYDVLDYLAGGMTEGEIVADFPDLTTDDIRACLAFAADREPRPVTIPAA